MTEQFVGRVALVTGGSRGVGRAIALRLAAAGATVVITYKGRHDAAAEVVNRIQEQGGQAMMLVADVGNSTEAEQAVSDALAQYGRLDILVNNAGITRDKLLMRMKEEDFDAVIQTNLKGAFTMMKTVSRSMMKQRSGRIINVTSVVGVIGNAGQVNYAASKAGIIGMTKSAARELASRNITVNAVAPGFIETDMTAGIPEDAKQALQSQIPLGRFGAPDDVAEAVYFLASDAAGYITGHILHIDGGMAM